jgi:hypothetical protein
LNRVMAAFDPSTVSKSSLCIRHSQAFGALMYIQVVWALHDLEVNIHVYDIEVLNGEDFKLQSLRTANALLVRVDSSMNFFRN